MKAVLESHHEPTSVLWAHIDEEEVVPSGFKHVAMAGEHGGHVAPDVLLVSLGYRRRLVDWSLSVVDHEHVNGLLAWREREAQLFVDRRGEGRGLCAIAEVVGLRRP